MSSTTSTAENDQQAIQALSRVWEIMNPGQGQSIRAEVCEDVRVLDETYTTALTLSPQFQKWARRIESRGGAWCWDTYENMFLVDW